MNRLLLPRWRRNIALVALLGIVCMMVPVARAEDSAKKLFKKGQDAEAREDFQAAYEFYHKAWLRTPTDVRYKTAYERLMPEASYVHLAQGRKLREAGDYTGAITEFLRALEINPSLEIAQQEIQLTRQKMAEANPKGEIVTPPKVSPDEMMINSAEAPVELKPISSESLTIHANEDSKVVYQTICKQAGLNVLFDSEYTSKRIQVDLTNTTLYDALRIVGAISGTFWKPITPNTIFVAADTRAKRTALEQMAVRTFYLTNPASQQDLNDVQTALRNVMGEGPKFFSVPSQNAILGRGTPDQLLLAEKIIDDLDKARPEVVLDVAILEVDRDLLRNIGIQLPGSFGLTLQPSSASTSSTTGSTTQPTLTLNDLGSLNATNFAVTVGTATANLLLTDSDTRILQSPRIRASDGQKATLKIGSRIPVATGSYSTGAATTTVSALVNTQFQYLDIGTNVEVTPTIHFDRDVTLKIKIEVLSENGNVTISGVTEPIIGQRSIEHTIRLKEGEVNILGGILEKNDLLTVGGTPGLGEIPILKYLFSSQQHEVQTYEVVFMLIPHVVRAHVLTPLNTRMIDTGTGNTIELRYASAAAEDGEAPLSPVTPNPTMPPVAPPAAMTASPAATPTPTVNLAGQPVADASSNNTGSTANAMGMPSAPVSLAPPHANAVPPPPPGTAGASAALPPVFMNVIVPSTPEKVGSTFQTVIQLNGGHDIYSVPLELHYDPDKLTLINVDGSDFLGSDGQTISLVHRDDGKGTVVINASRPPGAKGVDGSGSVCVATFVAKAPGEATVSITRAQPRNSGQQPIMANAGQAVVHIAQ